MAQLHAALSQSNQITSATKGKAKPIAALLIRNFGATPVATKPTFMTRVKQGEVTQAVQGAAVDAGAEVLRVIKKWSRVRSMQVLAGRVPFGAGAMMDRYAATSYPLEISNGLCYVGGAASMVNIAASGIVILRNFKALGTAAKVGYDNHKLQRAIDQRPFKIGIAPGVEIALEMAQKTCKDVLAATKAYFEPIGNGYRNSMNEPSVLAGTGRPALRVIRDVTVGQDFEKILSRVSLGAAAVCVATGKMQSMSVDYSEVMAGMSRLTTSREGYVALGLAVSAVFAGIVENATTALRKKVESKETFAGELLNLYLSVPDGIGEVVKVAGPELSPHLDAATKDVEWIKDAKEGYAEVSAETKEATDAMRNALRHVSAAMHPMMEKAHKFFMQNGVNVHEMRAELDGFIKSNQEQWDKACNEASKRMESFINAAEGPFKGAAELALEDCRDRVVQVYYKQMEDRIIGGRYPERGEAAPVLLRQRFGVAVGRFVNWIASSPVSNPDVDALIKAKSEERRRATAGMSLVQLLSATPASSRRKPAPG